MQVILVSDPAQIQFCKLIAQLCKGGAGSWGASSACLHNVSERSPHKLFPWLLQKRGKQHTVRGSKDTFRFSPFAHGSECREDRLLQGHRGIRREGHRGAGGDGRKSSGQSKTAKKKTGDGP